MRLSAFAAVLAWSLAACTPADDGSRTQQMRIDLGCDGEIDQCQTRVLNASGQPIEENVDYNCDGVPDVCRRYQLSPNGQSSGVAVDHGCDGEIESCTLYAFDQAGRLLQHSEDMGCDGAAYDICYKIAEQELENGRTEVRSATDTHCNDSTDGVCTYREVGPDGRVYNSRVEPFCASGEFEACITNLYSSEGVLVTREFDSDCNRLPELCRHFKIDAAGLTLRREDDADCDGIPDRDCIGYAYSAGRLVARGTDQDCDGTTDAACFNAAYDSGGYPIREEWDEDCDLLPEKCILYSY